MTLVIGLKWSRVKLELLTDYMRYLKFEAGMRGGLTQVSHRHCVSSQPGDADYVEGRPKSLSYVDKYDHFDNINV